MAEVIAGHAAADAALAGTGIFAPVFEFRGYSRARIEGRVADGVRYVIAAYAGLWIFAQAITFAGSGLRLDAYEMLLMGHEWQFSYWKHPALPPWMAEAAFDLAGHSTLALSVLPVACASIAIWLVWKLCRPILGTVGAAIATALSLGSWYLMTPVEQFNHNVAQLPFWVLTVLCYRRAILTPTYARWIALAVVAALLLATKYTGALLLLTLAGHALWFEEGRSVWRRKEAWPGMALGVGLIAAQLAQVLLQHQSALTYALDRPAYQSLLDHAVGPLSLLGAQMFFHLAIVVLLVAAHPFGVEDRLRATVVRLPARSEFDRVLLIASTAGPLALGLIFYGLSNVWGRTEAFGSMFVLVGPSVMAIMGRTLWVARPRLVLALAGLVLVAPPLASVIDFYTYPMLNHRLKTEQVPFGKAADQLQERWLLRTDRPLTIIAGDTASAGGVATFMDPRPSVLIDGELVRSPWITRERLAREGALIVWRMKDAQDNNPPRALIASFGGYRIERQPPVRLHTRWDEHVPATLLGVALVLPEH